MPWVVATARKAGLAELVTRTNCLKDVVLVNSFGGG
jgi:hypothetical protein